MTPLLMTGTVDVGSKIPFLAIPAKLPAFCAAVGTVTTFVWPCFSR